MSTGEDDCSSGSCPSWVEHFEELCSSEDLSIDDLQRVTKGITAIDELRNSSFFHRVCMNKNVTLEIVEYLLDLYPKAINCCTDILYDDKDVDHFIGDVNSAYPLHVACYNEECPNEVIQLLLTKRSTFQLLHVC